MDTPRTNLGDATYLGRPPPDFDMTQEPSFQSPSKDNNLLQQMRNGRAVNIRTPRGSRAPLGDKRNLPAGIGGSEFTPMLKSATRNSARRRGKENTNGLTTPALGKIDEDMDMTNVPVESSLFGPSRNMSYADATALPEVDASSTTSTPTILPTRRGGDKGPLQDGNQLSLREQENVIDKIEKENFGLKLKIHFLEEALRKTGPGFSEAALKENTELKVDKVTMQRELSKHKKQLASAEKDLETYQQQILDVQERAKKKYADQSQKAENDALRRRLEDREAEIEDLQRQMQRQSQDNSEADKLHDRIDDLEADLRVKDLEASEREDELDELNTKYERMEERSKAAEAEMKDLRQQLQQSQDDDQASQLRDKISNLEAHLREKDEQVKERDDEIDELEIKIEGMEERWKATEADNEDLQRRLQEQSQEGGQVNQLYSKISDLEASLRSRGQEVNECEDEIDELKTKSAEMEADLRSKDQEVNEREDEIHELNTKLEGMEEKQKIAKAEIEDLQRQVQQHSLDYGRVNQLQVNQLRDKISNLETTLRTKDREVDDREDEIDELKTKSAEMEADLRSKDQEVNERKDEIHELNTKLKGMEEKQKIAKAQIEELQQQVQQQQVQQQVQQHSLDHSRVNQLQVNRLQVNQLHDKISNLETTLRAKNQEVDNRKDEIDELKTKVEGLEADLRVKGQEVNECEDEIDDLKTKVEGLEADLRAKVEGLEANLRAKGQEVNEREDEIHGLKTMLERMEEKWKTAAKRVAELEENGRSREELQQGDIDRQEQAEKIEALEDEIEVLQATLDEESEDASQRLREADELCQDLKRQLELSKREQGSRVDRLVFKRKVDSSSRQQSREVTQANQATEDLKRQLLQAQKECKKAKLVCEDLRSQLDTARQDLDYANPLCKELRQKLDRARSERATYQASAEKLQVDCERLKKGAQEALAWIQARNAEKPSSAAPGPIKKAAMATFRYGDVVMDVVDQKDHEAVIRAADSAQRRHEKELRGMVLQMEWMQARWERESKLRNDGAFAKKFLQLRLDIADACNKADLRILNRIHQDLGIKPSSELLSKRQKNRKPLNKLKVFVAVIRAVARMRIDARNWAQHEKTRLRLVAAWEEKKQKEVVC
ncbi:hypothetical protein E0Z10_g10458 [Xylaria hypoxylon]|uniref:Centrosomin N-terminal motif 1 domain-containing protein n=1 Tax=Xylaria hypoxylon TaxID=37992 RepID=A0A4Z0Y611_9PEZI|nr:hypothetical protein E0Z10_g10458 [Xylaria hypoxylon]